MKICECGGQIPNEVVIDGKRRSLKNRKRCLTCCPYGSSIYSKRYPPNQRKSEELSRSRKKQKTYSDRIKDLVGIDPTNLTRKLRKLILVTSLGGKCLSCGYGKILRNLVFHHLDETEKEMGLSERSFQFGWERIYNESVKCILLCHNCHGEIHSNVLDNKEQAILEMGKKLLNIELKRLFTIEKFWTKLMKNGDVDANYVLSGAFGDNLLSCNLWASWDSNPEHLDYESRAPTD